MINNRYGTIKVIVEMTKEEAIKKGYEVSEE